MTAAAPHPEPRRTRAMAAAVARFWRLDLPMTGLYAELYGLQARAYRA